MSVSVFRVGFGACELRAGSALRTARVSVNALPLSWRDLAMVPACGL